MVEDDSLFLPALKQNARYNASAGGPLPHGRKRPRPANAAHASLRLVEGTGAGCVPGPAKPASAPTQHQPPVPPREPVCRPLFPPRPLMSALPTDGSLDHLSPSERMRLRRIT